MVAIPGGEPLIYKEIGQIVAGLVAQKRFVSLCTNALLLEKKIHLFEPSPYLFFSVHLDGLRDHHDKSVCQPGVFDPGVCSHHGSGRRNARPSTSTRRFSKGTRRRRSRSPSTSAKILKSASRFLRVMPMSARPTKSISSTAAGRKSCFERFSRSAKAKRWTLTHSPLFLDFLAGNQEFHCTPWGMPTRNIFGWQKPCYLIGGGYARSFSELMETTDWDSYGTGRYEKCANCMAHCGYEPTAAHAAISNPY